jgi:lipid-A-disaccharide synthase
MAETKEHNDIMIVAGESSGDLHGSNLIKAAAENHPSLHFFGVGGQRMKEAGCRILFPSEELSVMGVVEVVRQLPRIYRCFRQLKKVLSGQDKPALLVLIDFPDFNLRLAKVAKQYGVPVLYYISPKVWAWRAGRARTIAERVDRIALIFPFEIEIYRSLNLAAEYVGNPLLDEFAQNPLRGTLRTELNITPVDQVVGLFPGSRLSELDYIFESLMDTAQRLLREKPHLKFLVPVAPSFSEDEIRQRIGERCLPISLVQDNIYKIAAACDAVLTVSGTVTLQLALAGTPMAILYKVAPLSYVIGKRLIKIEFVGLTNIVAGRGIVREFIQDAADPEIMSLEILRLLDDEGYRRQMLADLAEVRERLGQPGSSERVADIIAAMIP